MAFALIIHTLDSEESELVYYRLYSAGTRNEKFVCLCDGSTEKKNLLYFVIKKVHMLYSLKLRQSLIPIQNQERNIMMKGCFIEKNWKPDLKFSVVWKGFAGVGFSLICSESENLTHAQSVLDLIITELEKFLKLVSYPLITTKSLDAVAVIVDYLLPGGQLLFLNSSMIKSFEKQIELDLQS